MRHLPVLALSALVLSAQTAPVLQPGEGLALLEPGGKLQTFGDAKVVRPMGSLAKLVWLRLEGDDWASWDVRFKCTGETGGFKCWLQKGHGRVHLATATEESCNLAFMAWATASMAEDRRLYGEAAARVRLEEVFRPFLGGRLAPGDTLPVITPPWIGDGDLLRTSPEAFLTWLAHPDQERLLAMMERLLVPLYKRNDGKWWMKTGTAPVVGDPGSTSAWVVGSDGSRLAVLHLPRGRGKAEGLTRFRQVMGLQAK